MSDFDSNAFEFLQTLSSFKERIKYAQKVWKKIGAGSGRIVFDIGDDKVCKLAKNGKGIMQNISEKDISLIEDYDFVAKVYNADLNGYWVKSEKAIKMKKSTFKQLTGFKFDEWSNTLLQKYRDKIGCFTGGCFFEVSDDYDNIWEDELLNNIIQFAINYDILPNDFSRISSWGVVNREGHNIPVIIDYGISRTTYNEFYVGSKK